MRLLLRTPAEKRAYQRGYQTRAEQYPMHKPPLPPHKILADFLLAATELRNKVDDFCAQFDEDDEVVLAVSPGIDRLDEAMETYSRWLRDDESCQQIGDA